MTSGQAAAVVIRSTVVDYRKLLGKTETLVLPYFGGRRLDAPSRRLRLADGAAPGLGWHRFEVAGRIARPLEPCEPEGLGALPAVRGHLVDDRLVAGGRSVEHCHFLPEEEPAVLSPCRARRWCTGEAVFEAIDFDTDAEELARRALEDERPLGDAKGIAASLRAAFGLATVEAASRRLGIEVCAAEAAASLVDVAARGRPAAEELLHRLARERAARLRELERAAHQRAEAAVGRQVAAARAERAARGRDTDPAGRADEALAAAGGRMLGSRVLGEGRLEVTFRFAGERFITVVDAATLQVLDAGVCLAGEDRLVTLDSLPAVLREAIDTDRLVITRR